MKDGFLRSARKAKGYTQAQVADEAEISRGGYSNIEKGKRIPSVKVAKKIGRTLDIDWTMFFDK